MPAIMLDKKLKNEEVVMRKATAIKALFISFALSVSSLANAGLITLNELQQQTEAGQLFNFGFGGSAIPLSDGTSGSLTIHARGDYDTNTTTEFLVWDINGLGIGGSAGPVLGGTTILVNNFNDVEWTQTFSIDGTSMLAITAAFEQVSVALNGNQGAGVGVGFQSDEFVEVSFSYNAVSQAVPEPSALAILALGLIGFGARRFTKK